MARTAIWFGVALGALGLLSYVGTAARSATALIPSVFGLLFILLGVLARNDRYRMHAMHAAAVVALLGVIGSIRGPLELVTLLSGGDVGRPVAALARAIMFFLTGAFLVLCIQSFRDARRRRTGL